MGLRSRGSREQVLGKGSLEQEWESLGKVLECLQRMHRDLRRVRGPQG